MVSFNGAIKTKIGPATTKPVNVRQKLTDAELFSVGCVPSVMSELIWDYADTLCDISANMKLSDLKKLTRTIRMSRREYVSVDRSFLSPKQQELEENLMIGFQDFFSDTFNKLYTDAKAEVERKHGEVEPESMSLVATSVVARICFKSLLRYGKYADGIIKEKCGSSKHSIIPEKVRRLGSVLHCFAGDLDIDMDTLAIHDKVCKVERLMHKLKFDPGIKEKNENRRNESRR